MRDLGWFRNSQQAFAQGVKVSNKIHWGINLHVSYKYTGALISLYLINTLRH